jgi:glutamate/tyrosine decarboxylase-like PLP-dependent enzyme
VPDGLGTVGGFETGVELARRYLASLADRPVGPTAGVPAIRDALGGPLPDDGLLAGAALEILAAAVGPGLVASAGPRYFGFVTGGALPAALGADVLTAAWDQNGGLVAMSPAAAAVEEVVGAWIADLLGLPASASFGLVTGGQMANVTALAAARHRVLADAGWDVERDGLQGAPRVRVLASAEAHGTIPQALRLLGLGGSPAAVETDGQGRMCPDALAALLAAETGPTIVCAQAGNVNTGAFDPLRPIAAACRRAGAWLHVDGAFGLWAAASPRLRHLVDGVDEAQSWATDGHKWLNVPYDCGIVLCADPQAHRAAMGFEAAYLAGSAYREPMHHTPEASRRARGFAAWAALRGLGRSGVADLVERCCDLAAHAGRRLAADPRLEVLNDVVLNQVLVRVDADDAATERALGRVQAGGVTWLGGTVWQGRRAMRLSVSNWSTTRADVDRSVDAILAAMEEPHA